MKRSTKFVIAMFAVVQTLSAQSIDGVSVSGVRTERSGKYVAVDMKMNFQKLDVEKNRAVLITPKLVNGADSVELRSVCVYGRRRYYYYQRNAKQAIAAPGDLAYRATDLPDSLGYHVLVPYEKWMNGAQLTLQRSEYGCCSSVLSEQYANVGKFSEEFFPVLVYSRPVGNAVKQQSLKRTAYIDFPVNKTAIYPEYRRNVAELGKIRATIDSVRSDNDITITSVFLKGYASPESPYAHNAELAKGRTAALKSHIQQLYSFADGTITTAYEPEDWQGLRTYVEKSSLPHRSEILDLIDLSLDPDAKEKRIKTAYPEEYKTLLKDCYPALRHTEYRVDYTIRSYTDVEEIKRVMASQPQKLSLNEFYLLSQQYEAGSDEFTEVFETAVRMYPTDEHANLNAANAAMRRGNLSAAQNYLSKAGSSAEAVYARAALAILSEDYVAARTLLQQAEGMGLKQATETLKEL